MIEISLSLFLILNLTAADVWKDCVYDSMEGYYLGSCYNNCIDFQFLKDAKDQCNTDPDCGGATFAKKEKGGSNSNGEAGDVWGYQLRKASDYVKSKNEETSWRKSVCGGAKLPFVPLKNKCEFVRQQGTYLQGCDQNCKDFQTLNEAKVACKLDTACKGITFSKNSSGGEASTNAYDGVRGYQLRYSNVPVSSKQGEDSWTKPDNCVY